VTIRLISSGIDRSRLRRPALTWAVGAPSFAVTRAHASVEFTSPTTTTSSGVQVGRQRLERRHHPAGLHGVAARARGEEVIGAADAEIGEEHVAHRRVVVLAGVHEDDLGPALGQCVHDRLTFMKLGRAPATQMTLTAS
jgi:hypothetical protein